jgi:hypothetical protein
MAGRVRLSPVSYRLASWLAANVAKAYAEAVEADGAGDGWWEAAAAAKG